MRDHEANLRLLPLSSAPHPALRLASPILYTLALLPRFTPLIQTRLRRFVDVVKSLSSVSGAGEGVSVHRRRRYISQHHHSLPSPHGSVFALNGDFDCLSDLSRREDLALPNVEWWVLSAALHLQYSTVLGILHYSYVEAFSRI